MTMARGNDDIFNRVMFDFGVRRSGHEFEDAVCGAIAAMVRNDDITICTGDSLEDTQRGTDMKADYRYSTNTGKVLRIDVTHNFENKDNAFIVWDPSFAGAKLNDFYDLKYGIRVGNAYKGRGGPQFADPVVVVGIDASREDVNGTLNSLARCFSKQAKNIMHQANEALCAYYALTESDALARNGGSADNYPYGIPDIGGLSLDYGRLRRDIGQNKIYAENPNTVLKTGLAAAKALVKLDIEKYAGSDAGKPVNPKKLADAEKMLSEIDGFLSPPGGPSGKNLLGTVDRIAKDIENNANDLMERLDAEYEDA